MMPSKAQRIIVHLRLKSANRMSLRCIPEGCVKGARSEAEEEYGGEWGRNTMGENNETETGGYEMLVDVPEIRDRLRRETVTAACLCMKVVKIINGRAIACDDCLYAAALC